MFRSIGILLLSLAFASSFDLVTHRFLSGASLEPDG